MACAEMNLVSNTLALQAVFNAYRPHLPYALEMNAPAVVPNGQPQMVITAELAERFRAFQPTLFTAPVSNEQSTPESLEYEAKQNLRSSILAGTSVQHTTPGSVSSQSDYAADSPNLGPLTINSSPRSGKFSVGSSPSVASMHPMQNSSQGMPQRAPKCSICEAESTGIHFGVEACAACSAFFRRTVVLNKQYLCTKNNSCDFRHDSPSGQKCRACRFRKCLDAGMEKNAVQQRRDAIGKYSTASQAVKREYSESICDDQTPYIVKSPTVPKSPVDLEVPSVFDELKRQYHRLNSQRKVFYCNTSVTALFDDNDLEFRELQDFADCMYQLYRVEPRLCIEFVNRNNLLKLLPSVEKRKIFSHFLCHFQAVEEPYLTWQFGGDQAQRYWVMPNKVYIDLSRIDQYFDKDGKIKDLKNMTKEEAESIFKPSFGQAMELVGARMARLDITPDELIFLIGLVLFDPTIIGISQETQRILHESRNLLIKELMATYENNIVDPELRLASVILIISGIKVHALRTRENMTLLNTFDVIPRDQLFNEIWDVNGSDNLEPKLKQHRTATSPQSVSTSSTDSPSCSTSE